jgi:acyl dehydratase
VSQAEYSDAALAAELLHDHCDGLDALRRARVGRMMLARRLDDEVAFAAQESCFDVSAAVARRRPASRLKDPMTTKDLQVLLGRFPRRQGPRIRRLHRHAEEIIDFATKFDPQPFHLSEEAGKASLFGGLCASGWHTCAITMRMMCDEFLLETASLGSPGLENIRWIKPVRPGDTLHVRSVVLEARPMESKPHIGLVLVRWEDAQPEQRGSRPDGRLRHVPQARPGAALAA